MNPEASILQKSMSTNLSEPVIHTCLNPIALRMAKTRVLAILSAIGIKCTGMDPCFPFFFSSPGRSPGRAVVLPLASALAAALAKC